MKSLNEQIVEHISKDLESDTQCETDNRPLAGKNQDSSNMSNVNDVQV